MNLTTATVESGCKRNTTLSLALIAANCLGIAATFGFYFSLSNTLIERAGYEELEAIRIQHDEYQTLEQRAQSLMGTTLMTEDSLDLNQTGPQLAALTQLLVENEKTYQIFFRLLKVNMYHLVEQIPGTFSWYEHWSPGVDESRFRL